MYRTRAIITRGLYIFYPLFEVHLCTMTFRLMYGCIQEQFLIKSGLKWRVYSNSTELLNDVAYCILMLETILFYECVIVPECRNSAEILDGIIPIFHLNTLMPVSCLLGGVWVERTLWHQNANGNFFWREKIESDIWIKFIFNILPEMSFSLSASQFHKKIAMILFSIQF